MNHKKDYKGRKEYRNNKDNKVQIYCVKCAFQYREG